MSSPAPVQFGQHPPALRTIVHLSDTHLLAGDRLLGGRYDTGENLRRAPRLMARSRATYVGTGPVWPVPWPRRDTPRGSGGPSPEMRNRDQAH